MRNLTIQPTKWNWEGNGHVDAIVKKSRKKKYENKFKFKDVKVVIKQNIANLQIEFIMLEELKNLNARPNSLIL